MIKEPLYRKNVCPVSGGISIYAWCDYSRITVYSIMMDEQVNIKYVRCIEVNKEFINMPKTTPKDSSFISEQEFYEIYDKVIKYIDVKKSLF